MNKDSGVPVLWAAALSDRCGGAGGCAEEQQGKGTVISLGKVGIEVGRPETKRKWEIQRSSTLFLCFGVA